MVSSSTTYGSEFSSTEQYDGIYSYIGGGDYTQDQQDALSTALFRALNEEVDARLPDHIWWQPSTSEFIYDIDSNDDMPDHAETTELFAQAWAAVEARYDEIEAEALGANA